MERGMELGVEQTERGMELGVEQIEQGPRSPVGNVSGNRCQSDCRSRGCEFDPGLVSYFRGD